MTLKEGIIAGRTRANLAKGLLVGEVVLNALSILLNLAQLNMLARPTAGLNVAAMIWCNDLLFGATAVCWLVWLHRAYGNLVLMGTRKSQYTPAWAVGWWFVPFMNLVRPYQIIKDLLLRSAGGNGLESVKESERPGILVWWWGVYITTGLLGGVIGIWNGLNNISGLRYLTWEEIFLHAATILSAGLALGVVARIDGLQRQVHAPQPAD